MTTIFIQVLTGVIGSIGFALLFNLKKAQIPYIIAGSAIGTAIYLLLYRVTESPFLSNLIASIFCTASAEVLARVRKAPATMFLIIHIIPLVPGGSLFYSMRSFILHDNAAFVRYASSTFYTAAGIAVGILIVTSFVSILNHSKKTQTN
jgi:uncharacterized membrane protein YjjB (DUF3815 family)